MTEDFSHDSSGTVKSVITRLARGMTNYIYSLKQHEPGLTAFAAFEKIEGQFSGPRNATQPTAGTFAALAAND